jgi:[ribosomal protein S18]-alanine N-acetyltransferase
MASPPGHGGIIRPAAPSDLPRVREIDRLCFDQPWPEGNFLPALQDLFLVYEQDDLWGFLVACSRAAGLRGVILRFAVHPAVQRQGIGSRLMTRALAAFREKQVASVELDVQIPRTEAKRFYEKFGFETQRVINADPEYEDEAFYIMKLSFS